MMFRTVIFTDNHRGLEVKSQFSFEIYTVIIVKLVQLLFNVVAITAHQIEFNWPDLQEIMSQ